MERWNERVQQILHSMRSNDTDDSAHNLESNIWQKFHLPLIYQQSAVHAFTICGIHVFTSTLIWIVQNYLQLLLCPVILITKIHFCMVLPTLTSPNFDIFRINWPTWWQSHPTFTHSVPLLRSLHWLPVRFRILFKINLLTYKTLCEKQPVHLHPCLLHHYHPIHWDWTKVSVCQSLGSRPTQAQELFTRAQSLWNNLRCLSIQLFQLLPSRNI